MELHIKAIEACEIPNMDVGGKSDPYLKFTISTSSQEWKTKKVMNTKTPIWNEEFHIPITSAMTDVLTIQIYDWDKGSKDDLISSRQFAVRDFKVGQVVDEWYQFTPVKSAKAGGKVRLVFHLDKSGATPFASK